MTKKSNIKLSNNKPTNGVKKVNKYIYLLLGIIAILSFAAAAVAYVQNLPKEDEINCVKTDIINIDKKILSNQKEIEFIHKEIKEIKEQSKIIIHQNYEIIPLLKEVIKKNEK